MEISKITNQKHSIESIKSRVQDLKYRKIQEEYTLESEGNRFVLSLKGKNTCLNKYEYYNKSWNNIGFKVLLPHQIETILSELESDRLGDVISYIDEVIFVKPVYGVAVTV